MPHWNPKGLAPRTASPPCAKRLGANSIGRTASIRIRAITRSVWLRSRTRCFMVVRSYLLHTIPFSDTYKEALFTGCSARGTGSSRLLVGERPTGTVGQAHPRTAGREEVVAGGVCARQRLPPNLRGPDRTRREEYELR